MVSSAGSAGTGLIPTAEVVEEESGNEDGEVYFMMQDRDVTFHYKKKPRKKARQKDLEESIVEDPEDLTQDWLFSGKLLRVKGTEDNIVLKEKKLRLSSLNSGDVFILDTALNLYVWIGRQSNNHEVSAAKAFAESIVKHRKQQTKVIIINEGEGEREKSFLSKIPGEKKVLGLPVKKYKQRPLNKARKDEDLKLFKKKLYRLRDSKATPSGFLFYLVSSGNLKNNNNVNKRKLDSRDVFILDEGFKLWVWIGKAASTTEREAAMKFGQRYLKKGKRPTNLPVIKVEEGKEPSEFFEHFGHFPEGRCSIC